jgi:protein involved in plasmid replication-relaxation
MIPPRSRVPKALPVLPGHLRVLEALNRYERLTAEQLRRLHFGAGSLTYVQTKLKELADAGYVLRVPVGRPTPHGSGPLVYSLDRRGRAFLASLGRDIPARLRQSEERERSSPHLRHSLAVVDVLILCDLLCWRDDRFVLARLMGERELKRRAVPVVMPGGRRRSVAVDAWADLRIRYPDGGMEQVCFAYEVDLGTEWQAAWREKVRALLAFEDGPYTAAFGALALSIVVVAPDDRRRDQLHDWTKQELTAQAATERADLFCFGTMPDDRADWTSFFFAPRWRVPGQDDPVPLI